MPRSPTHPDAIPHLDDGDDDEFDDDEDDEIIDDFDDNSQVEDIVDLYSRGNTPEPETDPSVLSKETPISLPETICHLQPAPKSRPRPLQPSNVLNIRPAELAPPQLSLITCEVIG